MMDVTKGDILVHIPDEDLPVLAEMYKKHQNWAPHVYSVIKSGMEWIKKGENRYMTFLSPNNCWREDGTFFVLLQYYAFDIFIFSLDESGKNVREALINTNRLDTTYSDRPIILYSVHNNIYPVVLEALKLKNLEIVEELKCYMFSIPKEEALEFNIECPQDVYIKELDASHASIVNQEWPHSYKNSEKYLSLIIQMNGGYGVFRKSDDELVSWILRSMLGQMSQLQTKEAYKKKGYGSLITKYMSKKLAEEGLNAFATVLRDNHACVNMFIKIGFKNLGKATYDYVQYSENGKRK